VALNDLLLRTDVTVIDLSLSRRYQEAHIRGAWFAIRARLAQALDTIKRRHAGADIGGRCACGLAAADVRALTMAPRALSRGRQRRVARCRVSADEGRSAHADEPVDAWLKPYERPDGVKQAMADYLAWETDLLPRIARDGCAQFSRFPHNHFNP